MRRGEPVPAAGPLAGPGATREPPPRPPTLMSHDAFEDVLPDTAAIARLHDDPAFSYGDLRARGIAMAQAMSGQLWTDYNLHDPGVTLLESLCYALTEGVFGAQADMADLLTAPDGRIHFRRHALHGPEDALPCRPTTETDWLRYLLDCVPAVRQLRVRMPDGDGCWHMALRVTDDDGDAAAREVARAFRAQRNLAEDLGGMPQVLRPRWCLLEVRLSVDGPRDVADILVDMVRRCADIVAAAPPRQPLQARLAQHDAFGNPLGTAELFEGPVARCGWIAAEDLRRDPANRLFFADLAHALRDIDGVADIGALRLVPLTPAGGGAYRVDGVDEGVDDGADDNQGDPSGRYVDSLPWHGDDWALQLRWPDTSAMLANWQVTRRGKLLHVDTGMVLERMADARQAQRVISAAAPRTAPFAGRLLKRPAGQYLPEGRYLSIWHHLPPLYREHHLAPRADAERQAQFGAYLALLEQWLAHGNAQLQHVRQLFSVERDPGSSYWWAPLDADDIPGLDGVHDDQAPGAADGPDSEDDVLDRRSRALDLLLALHGENCDQHSIHRFGAYFDASGWQQHLYRCKRRFLQRIVRHTRDRGGAFDYGRPSLGRRGNTAPLQERVGLMLGFAHTHSRLLAGVPGAQGLVLDPHPRRAPHAAAPDHMEPLLMWPPIRARIVAHYDEDVKLGQVHDRLAFHLPGLDPRALPAALFRCAAHAGRYHSVAGTDGAELWLGPDEDGRWWRLAVRDGPGGVLAPALYLHEVACRVQRDAEGLHLVEHVLLRPLGDAGPAAQDVGAHRISVVLPGWTARGADQSFRDLAVETVALGCPAHVMPTVHWLDAQALAAFEDDFAAWLAARMRYANDESAQAVAEVDAFARRLRERLAALPGGAQEDWT